MSARRLTRRSTALVLLAVMLFPGAALAGTMFRCAADGKVREACCCPSEETPPPCDADARIARSCCDIEGTAPASLTAARADTSADQPLKIAAHAVRPMPLPLLGTPSLGASALRNDVARLALGPSVFLKKHSFLL